MLLALSIVLLAIVVVLAAPVSMRFELAHRDGLRGEVRLRMLYGLIRVRSPIPKTPTHTEREDRTPPEKKPSGKRHAPRISALALIRQQPFRRRVRRFLIDIWHAVHTNDLYLRMRVGLGDPADTGRLWAVAGPVSGLLASVPRSSIILEPEFFDATFEFDSSGQVRFTPLTLLYHSLALAVSPTIWRGVRQARTP